MNDESTIENPPLEVVSGESLERIERADIDMQISTAKKYPRKLADVKKAMLDLATLDKETAETCFYVLRRKDKNEPGGYKIIQGPSVRLAEIAVNAFGNIRAGFRIIGNDGKMITAQGACHDLEKNTYISGEVKRRITTKEGRTFSDDMQIVTGNAAGSIALRNAVFKVIPMALIKPVYDSAVKCAVGDEKSLKERRERTFSKYKDIGISKERILNVLEKKGEEEIGVRDLEILFGMFTAIKDGEAKADELFPEISRPVFKHPEPAPNLESSGTQAVPQPPTPPAANAPEAHPKEAKKKLSPKANRAIIQLRSLLEKDKVDEPDFLAAMRESSMIGQTTTALEDVFADTLEQAVLKWDELSAKAKEIGFMK